MSEPIGDLLRRAGRAGFAGAAVGAVLLAIGALLDLDQLLRSYLLGWLYLSTYPLGCLGILMLHHMTGGRWGFAVRRTLEAGVRTLPVVTLLFLPVAVAAHELFPWADEEFVAASPVVQKKTAYLNLPFWYARAAIYFAVLNALAWRLLRLSKLYDDTGQPRMLRRERYLSGFGLVAYVLLMIFATTDWAMSLDPEWYSTVFNGIWTVGQGLVGLCVGIVAVASFRREPSLRDRLPPERFLDLGNLVLALTMLWAYMSFVQYLIIWSGNLPEEALWYVHRTHGGWGLFSVALLGLHFVLPFFLLLQRRVKRDARSLAALALLLLLMRFVDVYYMVVPSWHHDAFHVAWTDVVAPLAMVSLWVGLAARSLSRGPLLADAAVRHPPYVAEGARA